MGDHLSRGTGLPLWSTGVGCLPQSTGASAYSHIRATEAHFFYTLPLGGCLPYAGLLESWRTLDGTNKWHVFESDLDRIPWRRYCVSSIGSNSVEQQRPACRERHEQADLWTDARSHRSSNLNQRRHIH